MSTRETKQPVMPLWNQDESIDNLTDVMILGYFESIKGVFITK